jgi:hypothetical protein
MENQIREISLPNGLTIVFHDLTRRYFGDYHHVRMEIVCKIPVLRELFDDQEQYDAARSLVGEEVVYRRIEGTMGVPSREIETALESLFVNFSENSLSYLSSAQFPLKMVHSELGKIKRKGRSPFTH